MSLEKKFKEVNSINNGLTIDEVVNQCVQICDEFAIGFAEWMQQNTIYNGSEYYAYIGNSQQYKLNKLLEIYKQGL